MDRNGIRLWFMNIHDGLWLMGWTPPTLEDMDWKSLDVGSNVKMDQRKVDFTRCKDWLTNFIELSNYCCNMLQSPYPFVMLFVDKVSQIRSTTYRGFHRWGYPQIIHLKRIFRYKPSSYWGSTISGNPHIPCEGATYLVAKVTNPKDSSLYQLDQHLPKITQDSSNKRSPKSFTLRRVSKFQAFYNLVPQSLS